MAVINLGWSTSAALALVNGTLNLSTATLRVMLVDETYTFDPEDAFVSDAAAAAEPDGASYQGGHGGSGRQLISNKAFSVPTSGDYSGNAVMTCDPVAFTDYDEDDVKGAVIHVPGTSDDTDALVVAYVPFDQVYVARGETLTLFDGVPALLVRPEGMTREACRQVLAGSLNLSTVALKVMLLADTHSGDLDDDAVSDIVAHEPDGATYGGGFGGSGRKAVSGRSFAVTEPLEGRFVVEVSADPVSWLGYAEAEDIARAAIVHEDTDDEGSLIVGYLPFGATYETKGETPRLRFDTTPVAMFAVSVGEDIGG